MKTGIVLVNYNDFDSLNKFLDNVINYKIIDKIVIVDNNSNDDVVKKIKKIKNDKVHVIYLDKNYGYSYAINEGSKYLIELYKKCNIIVSNTDIIIDKEKDINVLLKSFNDDIAVIAPVILENKSLNRGWKLPKTSTEILLNIPYIHRIVKKKKMLYKDSYYDNDISYVDVVSGCFFIIKSDALVNVNYMDDNVFLYYEENILSKKLKEKNYREAVVNDIIVIHNHSVTIDKNIKKLNKLKIQKQSQYYYVSKYNNANIIQKFLIKFTSFISRFILSIYYKICDLKQK